VEAIVIGLGWIGIYAPMALGAIGSVIGCARAGQAACGAMLETESGYGRYVGVSAMPSSQVIYGIVIMLSLNRTVTPTAPAAVVEGFAVFAFVFALVLARYLP